MTQNDDFNPFAAGPVRDPEPDENGIIWPSPHSHEVSREQSIEAVSQVIASRRIGDDQSKLIFAGTWLHLTNRQFLNSLLTLTSLKLDELVERINLAFIPAANMSIPAWAASLIPEEGVSAGLPVELLADACISNYRTLEPEVLEMVMQDADLMVGYDQALLGTALLSAHRGDDQAALNGLLQKHTDPLDVLTSLLQVFDYLESEVDDTPITS